MDNARADDGDPKQKVLNRERMRNLQKLNRGKHDELTAMFNKDEKQRDEDAWRALIADGAASGTRGATNCLCPA
jgi:hypothetical protein